MDHSLRHDRALSPIHSFSRRSPPTRPVPIHSSPKGGPVKPSQAHGQTSIQKKTIASTRITHICNHATGRLSSTRGTIDGACVRHPRGWGIARKPERVSVGAGLIRRAGLRHSDRQLGPPSSDDSVRHGCPPRVQPSRRAELSAS